MRLRSLFVLPSGIETDVLTMLFRGQQTCGKEKTMSDTFPSHLDLVFDHYGSIGDYYFCSFASLRLRVVDIRSLFPCSTMYQFVNVTHGLYLDLLAAALQEHSPLIISASRLSSTNLVLPFPVSLIDKLRAAGFPSTSKSRNCLQTLGVHDERSESVIH